MILLTAVIRGSSKTAAGALRLLRWIADRPRAHRPRRWQHLAHKIGPPAQAAIQQSGSSYKQHLRLLSHRVWLAKRQQAGYDTDMEHRPVPTAPLSPSAAERQQPSPSAGLWVSASAEPQQPTASAELRLKLRPVEGGVYVAGVPAGEAHTLILTIAMVAMGAAGLIASGSTMYLCLASSRSPAWFAGVAAAQLAFALAVILIIWSCRHPSPPPAQDTR